LMFSKITAVRPGRRLLPVGFKTRAVSAGKKNLDLLDQRVRTLIGSLDGEGLIPLETAVKLLELAYENLEFEEDTDDERKAYVAVLELLSRKSKDEKLRDQVFLIAASKRDVVRIRDSGRFSDAPDTKQQGSRAKEKAKTVPVLMLMRQEGSKDQGWQGLPFWWPVIVVPQDAVTCVFAADAPENDPTSASPLAAVSVTGSFGL